METTTNEIRDGLRIMAERRIEYGQREIDRSRLTPAEYSSLVGIEAVGKIAGIVRRISVDPTAPGAAYFALQFCDMIGDCALSAGATDETIGALLAFATGEPHGTTNETLGFALTVIGELPDHESIRETLRDLASKTAQTLL